GVVACTGRLLCLQVATGWWCQEFDLPGGRESSVACPSWPMSSGPRAGLMGEGGRRSVAHPIMPEQPNTIIRAVDSPDPDEVPDLIERLGPGIVRGDSTIILCDLARLADADMATV